MIIIKATYLNMLHPVAQTYKIVVIGDGTVGKTCFCHQYAKKEFMDQYVPTVFDTYPLDMTLKDGKVHITHVFFFF